MTLTDGTKRSYRRWCKKLLIHTGKKSIKDITQNELDSFFAWMVRPMEYPRPTINQAKAAIKKWASEAGVEFDIKMVSNRTADKRPEVLINQSQAERLISQLDEPYNQIATTIFYDYRPPGIACKMFKSRLAGITQSDTATVSPVTFNRKIHLAAKQCDLSLQLSAKMLQQSGILNALRNGVDRDTLLNQAGIKRQQLAWYENLISGHIEA